MAHKPSNLEDVGLFTLSDLSTQTGVPRQTLVAWTRSGAMHFVKIEGVIRSTRREVARAAEQMKRTRPRTWEMAPELIAEIEAEQALAEQEMALA